MLLMEGLLGTLSNPPRWWVASVIGQAAHWARRRAEAYGDSTYRIPESWRREVEAIEPNLRPDPVWVSETSRQDLRGRFNRMSRNGFAAGQVQSP
jgi:hypothetical protein